jgi:hypothetical protein
MQINRLLLWITAAVLGAAATVMSSFGLIAVLLMALLVTPLVLRSDRALALSGLLMGFGALWTLLVARQLATGAATDDAQVWAAVGIVPVLVGSALLALVALRRLKSWRRPVAP